MDTLASGADLSKEPKFVEAKAKRSYLSPVYFRKESEPYLTLAIDTGMLLRDFSNLDLVQAAHRTGSIPAVQAVRDVNGRQVLATYAIVARPTLSVFVELPVEETTK